MYDTQKAEPSDPGGEMSSINEAMCDTQKAEMSGRRGRKSSPWLSCYPAPETYVSVPRSGRRVVEAQLDAGLALAIMVTFEIHCCLLTATKSDVRVVNAVRSGLHVTGVITSFDTSCLL
jgi:hypothetical protein